MIVNKTIGRSIMGLDINVCLNFELTSKSADPFTLIIGGMHGDERAVVPILQNFIRNFLETDTINRPTAVMPLLNPDGYRTRTRTNARGVDLNRNFPHNWSRQSVENPGPSPLSEPESQALHRFISDYRPDRIVSLHWALSEIDADGEQSFELAGAMWGSLSKKDKPYFRLSLCEQEKDGSIECPGSLGQWCGFGLLYPDKTRPAMITLELPYTTDSRRNLHPLPPDSFTMVQNQWQKDSKHYLSTVEPAVHTLLEAACT